MYFKRFLSVIALITVLTISCTSCTTGKGQDNNTQNEIKTTQENKLDNTTTNASEFVRVGNSNSNIANGGWIDEEDGWLYYGLRDGLYKCKEDGRQKEKMLEIKGGAYDINVIDEWVYYRSSGIYRIKTDGTGYEQIAAEDVRGGVHFVGGKIYNGSEYRMNFDGSEKERIYDKNAASGYSLNIVDGWIYYYDIDLVDGEDKIFKMRLDGSDKQAIYNGRSDNMIIDGDWIYFSNYEDNRHLYKMKTDGTEVQPFVDINVRGILVSDGWIYYDAGKIYKIRTDGSDKQQVCGESGDEMQLQGDWIYYTVKKDIYRVKTDGTNRQIFAAMGEIETAAQKENNSDSNAGVFNNIDLIHSYETKFGEVNAVTYPSFKIEYPSNWMVSEDNVTTTDETLILTNDRGVEIKYSYIGGVSEGELEIGGSTVSMSRVEVSKIADSKFIPGYVQATDHSDLGEFMVAKLKETGVLNMKTDSDFTDIDGNVSYAVLPKSRIGTDDSVRLPYNAEFAFWYSGYISFIAQSPDGQFSEDEEKEIISILSSFRTES